MYICPDNSDCMINCNSISCDNAIFNATNSNYFQLICDKGVRCSNMDLYLGNTKYQMYVRDESNVVNVYTNNSLGTQIAGFIEWSKIMTNEFVYIISVIIFCLGCCCLLFMLSCYLWIMFRRCYYKQQQLFLSNRPSILIFWCITFADTMIFIASYWWLIKICCVMYLWRNDYCMDNYSSKLNKQACIEDEMCVWRWDDKCRHKEGSDLYIFMTFWCIVGAFNFFCSFISAINGHDTDDNWCTIEGDEQGCSPVGCLQCCVTNPRHMYPDKKYRGGMTRRSNWMYGSYCDVCCLICSCVEKWCWIDEGYSSWAYPNAADAREIDRPKGCCKDYQQPFYENRLWAWHCQCCCPKCLCYCPRACWYIFDQLWSWGIFMIFASIYFAIEYGKDGISFGDYGIWPPNLIIIWMIILFKIICQSYRIFFGFEWDTMCHQIEMSAQDRISTIRIIKNKFGNGPGNLVLKYINEDWDIGHLQQPKVLRVDVAKYRQESEGEHASLIQR